MNWESVLILIGFILLCLIIVVPSILLIYLRAFDKGQNQHAILRNYPVLGKMRYILEKMGPELRQYLFDHDNTGKPFSREDFHHIVLPGKYLQNMVGYGSKRDFEQPGYFIKNHLFPKQREEMRIDNDDLIDTKVYEINEENLFSRKEHFHEEQTKPWLLPEEDAVVIGKNCKHPFKVRSLVGQSAMSYGALGSHAITALSKGIGMAKGSWMNTGEGGLSPHHLKGDTDIIAQIGTGLFGVRTKDGEFSWDLLKEKAETPQVKAFELKLGQGAKTRGGHVDGKKVNPEIAEIRNVEPYKTINSPNRFKEFDDVPSMFDFIEKIREHTGMPVGIKIVVGGNDSVEELAAYMEESGKGPDFITVDGSEGGTGASFQDLADSIGLPVKSAVMIVDDTLRRHGVRDRVKLIASGKLFTPDRVAVLLGMGADLVNIARAFMISTGCIMAQRCHTNTCPAGVATTDDHLQQALVIEEKMYRVTNFLVTLREGLFRMAAAAGIDSPTKFERKHVMYKDDKGRTYSLEEIYNSEKLDMKQSS
ncbi:MAG TPA: FMN-binding glutamate synthase family protein [Bacillales bacterium]|nr:FMN-binding glutamate synthase family protein [Bacillales bacterium]